MSDQLLPPLRIQAHGLGFLNAPMRALLRLPFPTPLSGRLMLISFTGRKSGKRFQLPVSYVQQGNLLLTPGGGKWKWNLQNGQSVRITLRGRNVLARPEFVKDADEVERLLTLMITAKPTLNAFIGIPKTKEGRLDRERLEAAISYGFRIIRWHLEEAQP
jgi:hypothetical protein